MAKKELSKKEQLKQNRKKLAEELSGMHIYKDNHNRYVYYDIFTKNGYVISNVPSYRNYANRFILAAVVGILVYTFDFGNVHCHSLLVPPCLFGQLWNINSAHF